MNLNMPRREWCESHEIQGRATSLINPAFSVLDIGCGIRPQQFITPELLICIEPHLEYVEILKRNLQDANALIIPLDALQALQGFPDRSVDSIFLIDVIEHMTKEVGVEVIQECNRVARQQVVLFTPLGFMPQETLAGDVDGWNLHGGDWQDHKSGWYPEDFPDWDIVACKQLHARDVKGGLIDPPYGGFYAIKSLIKTANYFNDLYANEILASNTDHLKNLRVLFPQLIDQVVSREILNSNLKCGIKSCQKTTELLIELGASKSIDEIFEVITSDKAKDYLAETRKFNTRLREFGAQFLEVNSREAEFSRREVEAAKREVALSAQCSELAVREAELLTQSSEVASRAAELEARNAEVSLRDKNVVLQADEVRTKFERYDNLKLVKILRVFKSIRI